MVKNILKRIIQDQRDLSKCIREGKDLNEIIKERGIIITKISESTIPKKLNIPEDIIKVPVVKIREGFSSPIVDKEIAMSPDESLKKPELCTREELIKETYNCMKDLNCFLKYVKYKDKDGKIKKSKDE